MKRFTLAALMALTCSAAHAQSSPGLFTGQVPSATQWNSYFAGKQDTLGYTPLNPSVVVPALTSTGALLLPSGTTAQQPDTGNAGEVRYNSTTGRFEFGIGGSWLNHVRLSGDTMTGALTLSAAGTALSVTNDATVTGNLTIGARLVSAGAQVFQVGNSSTSVFQNTSARNVFGIFDNAGANTSNYLQVQSAATGGPPSLQVAGIDGNSDLVLVSKGTGVVRTTASGTFRAGHLSATSSTTWAGTAGESVSTVFSNSNVSGTATGNGSANYIAISTDTVDSSGAGGGLFNGFSVAHNFGGAAMKGSRNVISALGSMTAGSGNTTGVGGSFVGVQSTMQTSANNGGTSGDLNTRGIMYGINPVVALNTGATFWRGAIGGETDVKVATGASATDKIGHQIVLIAGDAVAGSRDDVALSINNQEPTAGWTYGILFGRFGGTWSITAAGTIIGAVKGAGTINPVATNGVDFSNVAFSGNSWNDGKTKLSGTGQIIASKKAASGAAPGAGLMQFEVVAGTNAGSCKLIAYAGTSTTPVTVVDNVGASC